MNPFTNQSEDSFPDSALTSGMRNSALEQLEKTPFPVPEEEVWKYSKIGELDLGVFSPSLQSPSKEADVKSFLDSNAGESGLISVLDGWITASGNDEYFKNSEINLGPLSKINEELINLDERLHKPIDFFDCLNRSYNPETLVLHVPDDVVIRDPIYIKVQAVTEGLVSCPAIFIDLGRNSEVNIVEHHLSDEGSYLTVPVLNARIGENSRLKHSVLQSLGKTTWQVSKQNFYLERDAYVETFTAAFGGNYARSEIRCELQGRGAEAHSRAAYFGSGEQTLDFRTFQKHGAPDTTSKLLFKGALDDDSRSVYSGLIKVLPEAIRTRAQQTNRNIKLSDDAWAESVPNLEIETNDVVCNHASTVSGVDTEQLFYLESKGVETSIAERLIITGFFDEIISKLDDPLLVEEIRLKMLDSLQRHSRAES
ncbi:MAG: Fe-S cluster assembly protein SufD [Actinomycetota bacterium]|nr:Fe-S cluster assembly protein SufD [Actinomycetota bacterium]